MTEANDVLDFWFSADPEMWFTKDPAFDEQISDRFGSVMDAARAGQLAHWEASAQGLLALIIVLDQFSRNVFRNSALAFTSDDEALRLSHKLVKHPDWDALSVHQKQFAVMPMMHAEDLGEQENCLKWMKRLELEESVRYAQIHLDIIERFGRFPHRNHVLGRRTTPEEQAFLDEGGFAG
ncbi:Uncharacterized conserved protein, DUF924 family [Cohaesibacter sp. ES.047]|uniref:DUF924 family protein n=1 Tax=Cohaesibacter sp. ES.047 TaxID=1798205 RepID=UPI000BC0A26A|nr:DUF924 family protein [Cohaesibacter sp. ES.047]SNY90846.1 Uncharacterized conserved protein, DUF924 family [Cohaesibacter sp. ES.047]